MPGKETIRAQAYSLLRTNRVLITLGVVRVGGTFVVGSLKSDTGVRDVAIPPHLVPVVNRT